jgi:hypothetical protein
MPSPGSLCYQDEKRMARGGRSLDQVLDSHLRATDFIDTLGSLTETEQTSIVQLKKDLDGNVPIRF